MPLTEVGQCPYCGQPRAILTINAAAEMACVNRKTIYRWIRAGILEHCLLPSGAIRVFKDSLIRLPAGERGRDLGADRAVADAASLDTPVPKKSGSSRGGRRPTA